MLSLFKHSSNPDISFSGTLLKIGEKTWEVDYPIKQAFLLNDKVIVLFDPDAQLDKKFGQFPNLAAFNSDGEKLWTAELPTTQSKECYYQVNWEKVFPIMN